MDLEYYSFELVDSLAHSFTVVFGPNLVYGFTSGRAWTGRNPAISMNNWQNYAPFQLKIGHIRLLDTLAG